MEELVRELAQRAFALISETDDDPEDILFLQLTQQETMLVTAALQTVHNLVLFVDPEAEDFSKIVRALQCKMAEAINAQKEL